MMKPKKANIKHTGVNSFLSFEANEVCLIRLPRPTYLKSPIALRRNISAMPKVAYRIYFLLMNPSSIPRLANVITADNISAAATNKVIVLPGLNKTPDPGLEGITDIDAHLPPKAQ